MNSWVEVVGAHPVASANDDYPCHLIEVIVHNCNAKFDVGEFTQEIQGKPRENWEAPYLEQFLDHSGRNVVADWFTVDDHADVWHGDVRLAFFLHNVDFSRPLLTPFQAIELPNETYSPARLLDIEFSYDVPS